MTMLVASSEKGENISTEGTENIGEHRENRLYGRCSAYA